MTTNVGPRPIFCLPSAICRARFIAHYTLRNGANLLEKFFFSAFRPTAGRGFRRTNHRDSVKGVLMPTATADTQALLRQALDLHRAGAWQQAESLYRQALDLHP